MRAWQVFLIAAALVLLALAACGVPTGRFNAVYGAAFCLVLAVFLPTLAA